MSSRKTTKRKSSEGAVEEGEQYSRTSTEMVLPPSSSELPLTLSGTTATQADDHDLVATAAGAEDSSTTTRATVTQAEDHDLVATAAGAEDSSSTTGATVTPAEDHDLVATAAWAEDPSPTIRATVAQAEDHNLVATAVGAEDPLTNLATTASQAEDHNLVAMAVGAEDPSTNTGTTVTQADDHNLVAMAVGAEDPTTTSDQCFTTVSRAELWNLIQNHRIGRETVSQEFIKRILPVVLPALGPQIKNILDEKECQKMCKLLVDLNYKFSQRWKTGSRRIKTKDKEWCDSKFTVPSSFMVKSGQHQHQDPSPCFSGTLSSLEGEQDLDTELESSEIDVSSQPTSENVPSFAELKPRTQQRHIQKVKQKIAGEDVTKILRAVASEVQDQGASKIPTEVAKATVFVLKKMARSPSKPQQIAELVRKAAKENKSIPYTSQEALAVVIDHSITQDTYSWLQNDLRRRGFRAFPPYYKVRMEKKLCHPDEDVIVSESSASVSLQSLLNHTVKRIVEVQEPDDDQKVITTFMSTNGLQEITCTLFVSWGFDGSSCQSRYKIGSKEDYDIDDQNMLATTIIPLRLISDVSSVKPLWENSTPQSVRYCRPLRLQFVKETPAVIMNEYQWVQRQVDTLQNIDVTLKNGMVVHVNFKMYLTLIDGKVLSHITKTSSYQVCPICKATPKDFNDLNKVRNIRVIKDNLQHGLSPLHAWIRVLEFLLKLGYKNESGLQKAVLRRTPQISKQLKEREQRIQQEIRRQTGLLVDQPKAGGCGSTNDGNTARTVLSEKYRAKVASILGLETWLLDDLHTILSVLSSGLEIDSVKFGLFCDNLADRFVQKYPWCRMPQTIHKILVHGREIIEALSLPVGMLSEQAAESRHRLFRLFRSKHAFQGDRIQALKDIFHRSLEASDPAISEFRLYERQKKLKRQPLSTAALNLLRPVVFPSDNTDDTDEDEPFLQDHMDFLMENEVVLSGEESEEESNDD